MNTMSFLVWLLPVLFMLHDFEEIIMVEVWGKRYKPQIDIVWPNRPPFDLKNIHAYKTASFSIAVEILFLNFSVISYFSVFFQNYFLWFACLIGLVLHFVLFHIVLCIRFGHYVPGVITSIFFLLPGGWLLNVAQSILHYNILTILLACATIIALGAALFPLLFKVMTFWSKRVE